MSVVHWCHQLVDGLVEVWFGVVLGRGHGCKGHVGGGDSRSDPLDLERCGYED